MIENIITIARDTESLWRLYSKESCKLEEQIWNLFPNTLSDLIGSIYINTDYDDGIFIDIDCSKRYHHEMSIFLDKYFINNWTNVQESDYDNRYWIYINDKFYEQLKNMDKEIYE